MKRYRATISFELDADNNVTNEALISGLKHEVHHYLMGPNDPDPQVIIERIDP